MTDIKLPENDINALYEAFEEIPSFRDAVSQNVFGGYFRTLENIREFANIKKYRIVFIGEPGSGKTTAICNWLNLLKKKQNWRSRKRKYFVAVYGFRTDYCCRGAY